MATKALPPVLQKYVDHMSAAGRPLTFTEIVSVTPGINCFRMLKDRGLILDVSKKYEPGETYTGPRPSLYVLTPAGRAALDQEGTP